MQVDLANVVSHAVLSGGYRDLVLASPAVAAGARPGQFVHVRVPRLDDAALRRPFSIHGVAGNTLSLLYKTVGRGTQALASLQPGEPVSLIGPLGNAFPDSPDGAFPILVAGGYGVAPLSFLATRLTAEQTIGRVFIGGATADDILCEREFAALGWPVTVTTEDGSSGSRGLVTDALDAQLDALDGRVPVFYVCGPDGLLKAIAERAARLRVSAWLSLDKHMACGVGACLACVQKIRDPGGKVVWKRVCRDGPIFEASTIVWP